MFLYCCELYYFFLLILFQCCFSAIMILQQLFQISLFSHICIDFYVSPLTTFLLYSTDFSVMFALVFHHCDKYLRDAAYKEKSVFYSHSFGNSHPLLAEPVVLGLWWQILGEHVAEWKHSLWEAHEEEGGARVPLSL